MTTTEQTAQTTTRVLFSALLPAVRIAMRTMTPLREMKQLLELATYREARRQRMKLREIRDALSISMSKVGLLSKQLKEHFSEPYAERELPRRIISLLWAGPLSEKRLTGALDDVEANELSAALRQLLEQGAIVAEPGVTVERYRLSASQYRLIDDGWMARIDALNNLLESFSKAVETRFIENDDRSVARTVSFRVRPEAYGRIREAYERHIFPLIVELDGEVEADAKSVPVTLSFVVSPDPDRDDGSSSEPVTDPNGP